MEHTSMGDVSHQTLTFLFTDIVGSTRLWQQHAEAMEGVISRHNVLLATIVERHHGHLFKYVGDGVCTAFSTALDALEAALAIQRAFTSNTSNIPIKLRVALHSGAATLHNGDYAGLALSRTTRILAAGHGSQILLSLAAHELVCDNLPPEVVLRDLGAHHLKDLARPEHIFQVVAHDLPANFPPLNTLDRHQHNLPVQATALIGREREIERTLHLLDRPEVRLLTLTGPGGTGKTRLALQLAAEQIDTFADGIWFVNLAPVSNPTLVASTIAQTLGLSEAGSTPLLDSLKTYLRGKHVLLLLDNFEQVQEAAPLVADLLAATSTLKILVTSRAALHLSGEHEYAVPPLALPDPKNLPPLERLTQYEAVRLFIQRAQAVKADFEVTTANAPAVAEICVRLDGLPLAIELAAARVKLLPPQAMLARLQSRLTLLTGGARDLPHRQQTLRNTIDWSYSLLTPAEQILFARLAVFVGGRTLEAIEAVCNTGDALAFDTFDGVASLVDKSLLAQQEGADDEPRFVMLETIHEYARERLVESGDAALRSQQHAEYFTQLAAKVYSHARLSETAQWAEQLELEHDNIRAALTWLSQGDHKEAYMRLATSLWFFWSTQGYIHEGRMWLEAGITDDQSIPPLVRADVFAMAGELARWQGALATARIYTEQALALYRMLDNHVKIAATLHDLGCVMQLQDELVFAQQLHEEALALRQAIGDKKGIAHAMNGLAEVARMQGDYQRSRELHEAILVLMRETGDLEGVLFTLHCLGQIAQKQGSYTKANQLLTKGLQLALERKDKTEAICFLAAFAEVAEATYQSSRAARLCGAVDAFLQLFHSTLEYDAASYGQARASVQAKLGDAAFNAAYREGQAMTFDTAMAYVLEPTPISAELPPTLPAGLSGREAEVLRLVAQGLTNAQIAEKLVLSPYTVNAHLRSIYGKIGVSSRAAATRWASDQHLV